MLITGTEGLTEIEGTLLLRPWAGAAESLMEMIGTSGVTEIDGTLTGRPLVGTEESLTDMLGSGRVTPRDGALTFEYRPPALGVLTEMDGVSETEIVGTEGL